MSAVEKDAVRAAVPWANLNPMPPPAISSGNEWRDVPEAFKDIGALQKTSDGKFMDIKMKKGINQQRIHHIPSNTRIRSVTSPGGQLSRNDSKNAKNSSRRNQGKTVGDHAGKFAGSDSSSINSASSNGGAPEVEGWGWTWFERFNLNLSWYESQR